jgi:hypothetical protein
VSFRVEVLFTECAAMAPLPRSAEKGPEWKLVEILEEKEKRDPRVKCIYCNEEYSAGASRIRAHILGNKPALDVRKCSAQVRAQILDMLKNLEAGKAQKQQRKRTRKQLDQQTSTQPLACSSLWQSSTGSAFARANHADVDRAMARAFYGDGLSFNLARSPYFQEAVKAIASAGPGYQPSKIDALRTTLLQQEKRNLEQKMQELTTSDLARTGCTVTSDGWSSTTNRPLLNVIMVTLKGETFLKAIDTSGEKKSARYIADLLIQTIEKVCSSLESASFAVKYFFQLLEVHKLKMPRKAYADYL